MLISPVRTRKHLAGLVSHNPSVAPHTALLILPRGQLLSSATAYDEYEPEDDEDVVYLDHPERLRLLLGLASQWEEESSPRVECELGRLLLCFIPLPPTEIPPPNAALPVIRPPPVRNFVLVLNGTAKTSWQVMANKADEFKSKWT